MEPNNMKMIELIEECERLQALKEEYLNMFDNGAAMPEDRFTLYEIATDICDITARLKNITEIFTDRIHGGYIAGYRRYNGVRIVSYYIRSIYAGNVNYTLDYTSARRYTSKAAAHRACKAIKEGTTNI